MLTDYIPVLLMLCLALAFSSGSVVMSYWLGPRKDSKAKLEPYECGMPPVGNPRERFNVKFFLVAMVFVIFDIEILFLFLWAILFKQLGVFGLIEMTVFLGILLLGLVYVWQKGVLEWASKKK